ncbi:MAG: hypothetical protein ABIB04_02045 [Patescibacteria group bacterium]
MNKENWQWLLLALVGVGLIGFGALIINQNSQLMQVSKSLTLIGTQLQDLSQRQASLEILQRQTAEQNLEPLAVLPSATDTTPTVSATNLKQVISKLTTCDAKKESGAIAPDRATLIALGLESLLTEGFSATRICFDTSNNRVAFILAKQNLTSPSPGVKPTCVDSCDNDIFGTIDAGSGALYYKRSMNQLGIYSESYNQYCFIDKTMPGTSQTDDKILFYCGSGESGGLTGWYQYELSNDKLTSVQEIIESYPENFNVLSPTILKLFKYKSNAEMQ